jgi:F0F1-type ATP synthase assembly protein I
LIKKEAVDKMVTDKKVSYIDKQGNVVTSSGKEDKKEETKSFDYTKYTNIGFYLIIPLLAGVFLGIKLDEFLKTKPVFTIVCILLGTVASFYNLIKLTQDVEHQH